MSEDTELSRLAQNILESRIAIVIGKIDSGKSTLIKKVSSLIDVSIVDADIGQSDIGPPSVVSLGKRLDGQYRMVDGYFCGSTTPSGHFLQLMAGTVRMVKASKKFPVLVNTIGLVTGDIGRSIHTEVINALDPDLIICIGDELEYLDAFGRSGARIIHLSVSTRVRKKTVAERTMNRQLAFKEHFCGASSRNITFDQFSTERSLLFNGRRSDVTRISPDLLYGEVSGDEAIVVSEKSNLEGDLVLRELGVKILYSYAIRDFVGVLVGLTGEDGVFRGLGIIERINFIGRSIKIFTTVKDFSVLQFGSIKLDMQDFSYQGAFHPRIFKA